MTEVEADLDNDWRSLLLPCACGSFPLITGLGANAIGDPGIGGIGGGIATPELGRDLDAIDVAGEDEEDEPPPTAASAVHGRLLCAEPRFSCFAVRDSSGDDFLCNEGSGVPSAVVIEPDGSGGIGTDETRGEETGEDVSEMAASEPRRPNRGLIGDRGAISWRDGLRLYQGFFSSFEGVPFGSGRLDGGIGEDGTEGEGVVVVVSCVWLVSAVEVVDVAVGGRRLDGDSGCEGWREPELSPLRLSLST